MRNQFKEFYGQAKVNFANLNSDTLVIFDTNSLLNIYRYSNFTSKKFIQALTQINKNVWIPYQVALEFNLNRKKVMEDIRTSPEKFSKDIELEFNKFMNKIESSVNGYVVKSVDAKEVKKEMLNNFNDYINTYKDKFINEECNSLIDLIETKEDYLDTLIDLLEGKVGESYDQERINEIVSLGEERYKNLIPPGYMDNKKEQMRHYNGFSYPEKFGDLIVWFQMLDKAKNDNSINKIVFITDDNKEDWWYYIGPKNIGPRAELKNEMERIGDAELIMINSNSFIQQVEETEEDIVEESKGSGFLFFFDEDKVELENEREIEDINNSRLKLEIPYKLSTLKTMLSNDLNLPIISNNLKQRLEEDIILINLLENNIKSKDYFLEESEIEGYLNLINKIESDYFKNYNS